MMASVLMIVGREPVVERKSKKAEAVHATGAATRTKLEKAHKVKEWREKVVNCARKRNRQ